MGGGKKAKVEIAQYRMSLHLGWCHAVDSILNIWIKDKAVFNGNLSANGVIGVDRPKLFGGDKEEGGLQGNIHVLHGRSDQVLIPYLKSKFSADASVVPEFRGILSTVFTELYGKREGFYWSANNPYLHPIWMKVRSISGVSGGWYPEKAAIGGSTTEVLGTISSEVDPLDMNFVTDYFAQDGTIISIKLDAYTTFRVYRTDGAGAKLLSSFPIPANMSPSPGQLCFDTDTPVYMLKDDNTDSSKYGFYLVNDKGEVKHLKTPNSVNYILPRFAKYGEEVFVEYSGGTLSRFYGNALTHSVSTPPGYGVARSLVASGDYLYVARQDISSVFVYYRSNLGLVTELTFPPGPLNIAPSPRGVYVCTTDGSQAYLYELANADFSFTLIHSGNPDSYPVYYAWATAFRVQNYSEMIFRTNGASFTKFGYQTDGPDMNPAHIIRACLTNTDWGLGLPSSMIDDTSFTAAADTLATEGFGLSMVWTGQTTIEQFINEVLDHIDGTYGIDPDTGKFYLKLIRQNYTLGSLPLITSDDCTITSFSRKGFGETTNEVVVTWRNPDSEQDETVVVQDPANYAAQGQIISTSLNYYGIRNAQLAVRAAMRELGKSSYPVATVEISVNRKAWNWKSGDVVKLTYPEYGIEEMPCRVTSINYGKPGEMAIKVSLMEDVFNMPDSAYVVPSTPATPPSNLGDTLVKVAGMTAPYFAVAKAYGETWAEMRQYPDAFNLLLAGGTSTMAEVRSPTTDALGQVTYQGGESIPMSTCAKLGAAIGKQVRTDVSFTDIYGDDIGSGSIVVIGEDPNSGEICVVEAILPGAVRLRRGMFDTVPADWAAGTTVWFFDWNNLPTDNVENTVGSTKSYLIFPAGGDDYSYLSTSITYNDRMYRPYRPANVKINNQSWPTTISGTITVSWSERNRLLENGSPLRWDEGSVMVEPGTTYTLRFYDQNDVLRRTVTGLTDTSYTWGLETLDCGSQQPRVRIELEAVRDGYVSFQKFNHVVLR